MSAREIDRTRPSFVSYMDRTREYYLAQGYGNPYRWACHEEVPFARLAKPLGDCRVTLVTTASRFAEDGEAPPLPKRVWSGSTAEPPERLYTADLAWDKEATHTDDVESFLPIHCLEEYAAAGRIGSLAARFHGVPTEYSQRRTIEQDAPEILRRCREDEVDVALLVPL
jgi:hypothetical protein